MSTHTVRRGASPAGAQQTAVRIGMIAGLGMLCMTLLLFAASLIALHNDFGKAALTVSAYVCCALPALLCGFLGAKTAARHKALCGVLSAIPIVLLCGVLCVIIYGKVGAGWGYAAIAVIVCALLGSLAAVRPRTVKRKYKR